MSLILKNNSGADVSIDDLEFTVIDGGTYDLTTHPIANIRRSGDLILKLADGSLVLNDGIADLPRLEAVHVIYGSIRDIKAGVINDQVPTLSDLFSSQHIMDLIAGTSPIDHVHNHSEVIDDQPQKHFLISDNTPTTNSVYSGTRVDSLLATKTDIGHTYIEDDIIDLQSYVVVTRTINTGLGLSGGGTLENNLNLVIVPGDIDHTLITNIGTNNHQQIDSHIADQIPHRAINDVGTLITDLFSAQEIITRLATKEDVIGYIPENVANKGEANGYAPLNADGKLPDQYLTQTAIVNTFTRNSESDQLALIVQEGDVCVRTDISTTYIALNSNNTSMGDWRELLFPSPVLSVNGHLGYVVLNKTDIGLSNIVNSLQFSVQNNLSESTDIPQLRTNISVPSISDLQAHIDDTNAPHGAEISQWDAKWIQDTLVDPTDIGHNKALIFNSESGSLEYESVLLGYMETISCMQIRRVSIIENIPYSWTTVLFETIDVNNGGVLSLEPGDYRNITIGEQGTYKITYTGGVNRKTVEAQIIRNSTDVITGSFSKVSADSSSKIGIISQIFIAELMNGDVLNMQMRSYYSNYLCDLKTPITLTIVKLDGIRGAQGPQGVAGGTISIESSSTQIVDQCNTVNFNGSGVSVVDGGNGVANITIDNNGTVGCIDISWESNYTSSTCWSVVNRIIFPGTYVSSPTSCDILGKIQYSSYHGKFQIWDVTNNNQICLIDITNTDITIFSETLSNLSVNKAIWELRLKSNTSCKKTYIYYFAVR